MEPRINYARTTDGVNIAYATIGDGPPLVMASTIWGSLHMAQSGIDMVGFWSAEELQGLGRKVIVHDARGSGLSDRGPIDYSLGARTRDLEAVVRAAGVERFPLYGAGHGAATAIAFAAEHPVFVEQLIIVDPFILGAEYFDTNPAMKQFKATEGMLAEEWAFVTRSLASAVLGFDDEEKARRLGKAFQTGMRPADVVAFRDAAGSIDLGDLTERITVPTLVVRDDTMMGPTLAREVAARISGAQFVVGDLKRAVREALHLSADRSASRGLSRPPGMTAILFTDIVDSTALTERMGDAAYRALSRSFDERVRAAIREHGGSPVDGKVLGDGVMGVFPSAAQAIAAARVCVALGEELPMHIGLHAGDVLSEGTNVYGGAVNIASRICGLCAPGEILVSDVVRGMARSSAGVEFEDRGEHQLKGIGEAVRVYAVRGEDR